MDETEQQTALVVFHPVLQVWEIPCCSFSEEFGFSEETLNSHLVCSVFLGLNKGGRDREVELGRSLIMMCAHDILIGQNYTELWSK